MCARKPLITSGAVTVLGGGKRIAESRKRTAISAMRMNR